jgi:hypothetical protein
VFMAASDEWQERHLTADGWVDGSHREDGTGRTDVPLPANRVLTSRYTETWSFGMLNIDKRSDIVWRGDDEIIIKQLLAQYGEAAESL